MDEGELRIQIEGQPALTLRVESSRAEQITLDAHWNAVSIAWDQPPDRLYLELGLDACLPENGSREPYGARAGIELLERKLAGAPGAGSTLVWANPDAEYPGAVTFDSVCATAPTPGYRAVTDAEIGERLYEAWRIGNNAHKGEPIAYPERRTSLSGMRGKIGLATHDGQWHVAAGSALSNWIAKREDSPRLRGEAGIESLCQETMDLMGVPAAQTLSRVLGDQQCVLSKRADRSTDPATGITAIHQEDFAQATAWPGGQKYDGGTKNEPRWDAAYTLLRAHGTDPDVETAKLTRMLATTWMLGHCDLHRRNLGFTHVRTDSGRGIRLAPMYDVSSAIGTNVSRRLAIGIARQRNLAGIGPRQWLAHARECGLDPTDTLEIVQKTVRDTPEAIAAARETVGKRDENRYQHVVDRRAEELIDYARTRARVFEENHTRRFTKRPVQGVVLSAEHRSAGTVDADIDGESPTPDEIEVAEHYLRGRDNRPALDTLIDEIATKRLDGSTPIRPDAVARETNICWRLIPYTQERPKDENQWHLDRENRAPVRSEKAGRTAARMLAQTIDQYQREEYGQTDNDTPQPPPHADDFFAWTAKKQQQKREQRIAKTIQRWRTEIAPNLLVQIRQAIIPLETQFRRQLAQHRQRQETEAAETRHRQISTTEIPAASRSRERD